MRNKKLIIAIAGLVVLIFVSYGIYYFMNRDVNDPSGTQFAQNNEDKDQNNDENGAGFVDSDSAGSDQNGIQGVEIGENADLSDGTGINRSSVGDSEPIVSNNSSGSGAGIAQGEAVQDNQSSGQTSGQTSGQSSTPNTQSTTPNKATSSATQADTSGTAAADFTVYNASGSAVKLSQLYGKPIVVNFWASWCSPCKNEMPYFQSAYDTYGDRVQFVMVNLTDGQRETKSSASSYISGQGYSFPVYFDTSQSAANAYSVYSVPQTFFINKNGRVITKTMGSISKSQLTSNITAIIGS